MIPRLGALRRVIGAAFLPRAAVLWGGGPTRRWPVACRELAAIGGGRRAHRLRLQGDSSCDRPTTDPETLAAQVAELA